MNSLLILIIKNLLGYNKTDWVTIVCNDFLSLKKNYLNWMALQIEVNYNLPYVFASMVI